MVRVGEEGASDDREGDALSLASGLQWRDVRCGATSRLGMGSRARVPSHATKDEK